MFRRERLHCKIISNYLPARQVFFWRKSVFFKNILLLTIILSLVPIWLKPTSVDAEEAALSPFDQRLMLEEEAADNRFSILPHKQNYILPLSYNARPNQAPWTGFGVGKTPVKKAEIKFQISIKIPLLHDLFKDGDTLFAGYTQKTFWQAYNKVISSPFRDTNYNPELFYRMKLDDQLLGLDVRSFTLGFEHESNGRAEPLSRSWNRVYAQGIAEKGNLALALKAWYRIPEKAAVDNNPDITKFMGYGELYASYKYKKHRLSLMFRPAISNGFRSGTQLDWSFPLIQGLQGYVQYYNGYGESLIDYNHYNNRIGVGVIINNWL